MFFPLIITLSAILRLSFLSTIEFKEDEAVNLFLAARPLFGHGFSPGATISSYGILNPPLFLYILLPFILVSTNPIFISGCIATINSIAVGFFYLFVKRYYDKVVAIFASLFLAVSPWAILYSRKIWTQDLVVPLCIVLLFSVHKIVLDKRGHYWFLYILTSLLMLQMHQATLFFVIIVTILFLSQRPKVYWQAVVLGFVTGLLPLIPYLVFDTTHGFLQMSQLMHANQNTSTQMQFAVFMRPFQIINQGNFHFVFGDDIALFATEFSLFYKARLLLYSEYGLLLLGAYLFYQHVPRLRWLVLIPILLPLLYFLLKIAPEMHYAIPLLPLLALFLGQVLAVLWQKNLSFRILTSLGASVLYGVSIGFMLCFYLFLTKHQHVSGDYGTIFAVIDHDVSARLSKYKAREDYEEMRLASFIPEDYMVGKQATALMLYDHAQTKQHEKILMQQLSQRPEDARIRNELLAFFTVPSPSLNTIYYLEQQKKLDSTYTFFYRKAYEHYLGAHYFTYYDGVHGFRFEYPQHWHLQEHERMIVLRGDRYLITFLPLNTPCTITLCTSLLATPSNALLATKPVRLADQSVTEIICTDTHGLWCGSLYETFQAKYPYAILLQADVATDNSPLTATEIANPHHPLQEVLQTIRYN